MEPLHEHMQIRPYQVVCLLVVRFVAQLGVDVPIEAIMVLLESHNLESNALCFWVHM